MKRRNFVASVFAGGVVAAPTLLRAGQHEHDGAEVSGPQAHETVAFGQWKIDPPLNRFNQAAPNSANNHHQQPFEAQIKAGGSVTFAISGFHILGVYGPGTDVDDINTSLTLPIPLSPPGFPPVINDPRNRVYWGVNPFSLIPPPVPPSPVSVVGAPLDRVETVTFGEPGTYLVICTFTPHFSADPVLGKMHGFVKVLK
jgi:hypothetical protein